MMEAKNIPMIKRIFIFTLLSIISCQLSFIYGQSMTDDQVIDFVTKQQAKGDNQATIVQKLLKKGVTVQQLKKIRKNMEAKQNQLGAVDISGTGTPTSGNRLRTDRQLNGESYQQQNNYMLRSKVRGQKGTDNYTQDEQKQLLNGEIGFLDIDSLLYYRNMLGDQENQVFGHNLFNNPELTFQPNMNIATPSNYRLGAGDAVIIDVWGASQETFEGTISPDGTVTVEGVGPVKLADLTVAQAQDVLSARLGRYYSGSDIRLSLGDTRSIIVQVMGEVRVPGTYTLSSLSTSFNALYAAGGISDIGTLRDIKVYRSGRQIASIDVYDYILNGNSSGDVRLQDNDVIVVGPYDCLVRVKGRVKRPMFYEMKKDESVSTVIGYAGGFAGDAYKKNIRLIRKSGTEYSIFTVGEFDMNSFKLTDGDSLYVDSVVARYSNMVEIRGAVFHPGMYQMGGSISGVRDLILAAEGVREDAFMNRGVMHREKPDKTLEVVSVDIKGLLEGSVPDIPLRKNDVIYIPSRQDYVTEQVIKIDGEVIYPGTYQYADNTTLEDIVLQAGGLTTSASTTKVDVFRRVYDPKSTTKSEVISETYSFALKDGFVIDGQQGFVLQPFDEVVVRKSPTYTEMQSVEVTGAVNFEGSYSLTTKNYRLSDLVKAAGGLTDLAYAKGARLERQMTEEEKQQNEASLRTSQIALYEEAMKGDKDFDLEKADTLLNMKLDLSTVSNVAIDLEKAMQDPGGRDDLTLRDGDKLIIPQYTSTVKITGDVMYPITMNYKEGESLNYYIKRAGGYGDNARRSRVYAIYMNGSVELLSHRSKKAVQPGCQIVVPSKNSNSKMTTAEYAAMGTSAASIATMMVTIANLLK